MDKEWVDVANNVVKIGLPALITGFVTVFGMRHNAKSSQDKFMLEHKVKVLEKVSDDVDTYFTALNMLFSKVGAITKRKDHDLENVTFTDKQIEAITTRDKVLTETWGLRQSSLSKLRLLKAKSAAEKLNDCAALELLFRDMLVFNKEYPNYNQLTELRSEVKNQQKKFHQELANFYESIAS